MRNSFEQLDKRIKLTNIKSDEIGCYTATLHFDNVRLDVAYLPGWTGRKAIAPDHMIEITSDIQIKQWYKLPNDIFDSIVALLEQRFKQYINSPTSNI